MVGYNHRATLCNTYGGDIKQKFSSPSLSAFLEYYRSRQKKIFFLFIDPWKCRTEAESAVNHLADSFSFNIVLRFGKKYVRVFKDNM